mmetsp:Transcript_47967/g.153712  ORF Transcript_47967/g.153712 Transcript_47967/m.153712 type:complete len:226 (+) Transcript_47967:272-949(+)
MLTPVLGDVLRAGTPPPAPPLFWIGLNETCAPDVMEKHRFAQYAHWVVPGLVMAGRYPYVEPSRCLDKTVAQAQLEEIVGAGMDTFVCLQKELPLQKDIPVIGARGFKAYRPAVLDLRGEDTRFLYLPITDLDIPSLEDLDTYVAAVKAEVEDGRNVYIHCWGGRGRAAILSACLLGEIYDELSPDEVLERIQMYYDTRQDDGKRSPETPQQRGLIREYVAKLRS